jgi:hypothetical protein
VTSYTDILECAKDSLRRRIVYIQSCRANLEIKWGRPVVEEADRIVQKLQTDIRRLDIHDYERIPWWTIFTMVLKQKSQQA